MRDENTHTSFRDSVRNYLFRSRLDGYVVLFGYEEIIPTSPAAMEFFNEPYLLAMEKGVEIIAGFMLLIRRFVPLAIILLASLVANILAFHIFVDSELLPLAIVVTLLEGVLVWGYWEHFRGLFASKPTNKMILQNLKTVQPGTSSAGRFYNPYSSTNTQTIMMTKIR